VRISSLRGEWSRVANVKGITGVVKIILDRMVSDCIRLGIFERGGFLGMEIRESCERGFPL
jgi:hypothetical protein